MQDFLLLRIWTSHDVISKSKTAISNIRKRYLLEVRLHFAGAVTLALGYETIAG